MHSSHKFLVAVLLLSSGHAAAVPLTLSFSGVLTDSAIESEFGEYNGQGFSGSFTFDLDRAPAQHWNFGSYGLTSQAHTEGGCKKFVSSACVEAAGGKPASLVIYSTVIGNFGKFTMVPNSGEGFTSSWVSRATGSILGTQRVVYILDNEVSYSQTLSDGYNHVASWMDRAIVTFEGSGETLFDDVRDLERLPDLNAASAVTYSFGRQAWESECLDVPGGRRCRGGGSLGGEVWLAGDITKIQLRQSERDSEVPEPATALLLLSGIASLAMNYRRPRHRT